MEKRKEPPKYTPSITLKDKIFFLRILCRWRGSVWQMLWLDLAVFVSLYIFFNAIYHFLLSAQGYEAYKSSFERFVMYVQKIATNTPLSFLLGFFVSAVLARWWSVCTSVPFLSRPALLLHTHLHCPERPELARKARLNVLRYMNLAWVMAMKPLSLQIFRRFALPGERESDFHKLKRTMDRVMGSTLLVPARAEADDQAQLEEHFKKMNADPHVRNTFGELITKEEIGIFAKMARQSGQKGYKGEYWIPIKWSIRILEKAREAGIISEELRFQKALSLLESFRGSLGALGLFNDINIPLVYTQVILVAVYSFFLAEIFSSQLMAVDGVRKVRTSETNTAIEEFKQFDNFVPIFSIFKFIFFMGWFKTAISLLNPLGGDTHDFPTSKVLDYNLKMAISCGSAGDEVFPRALVAAGDPVTQLAALRDFSGPEEGAPKDPEFLAWEQGAGGLRRRVGEESAE